MDPLSVAASVAGVAAVGVQLSQTIYDLISTFYEAEKEMSSIANDLSLLAMVLNELEGVLRRDSRVYRRRMVRVVNEILNNCESVFQSISTYVSINPQNTTSSMRFQRKVRWYFQRPRVAPLQAGLESMKSTLNVLLHVVHLARVTEAAESFIPNSGTVYTQADVHKERRVLVGVVLDNRRSILSLKQIEEDRDRGQNLRDIIGDKREIEGTDSDVALDGGVPNTEHNLGPTETTDSGRFSSLGVLGGGRSANTGINASLFSKTTMDSPIDTTYSSVWSPGGKKRSRKDKITITDPEKFGAIDENDDDEANEIKAGANELGASIAANFERKQNEKKEDLVDAVPNVTDPIVIDTSVRDAQAAAEDFWGGVASSKAEKRKKRKKDKKRVQKEVESNNRRLRNASPDLNEPVRSASQSEHVAEVYEVSEAGSSGSRSTPSNGGPERDHVNGADDLPTSSERHSNSLSQSSASEHFSTPAELPDSPRIDLSGIDLSVKASRPQVTSRAERLATKFSKSQGLPPETEIVTPTAQWFLSVVPHEPSVTALIVRPRFGEADHIRARAEETAKTLLLNWTNVDPDVVSGEESSGGWKSTDDSNFLPDPAKTQDIVRKQPYQMPYTPPTYPAYTPQQWYPPPLPPALSPPDEKQTDGEELARLKKLILDEKAEQDMKVAAAASAAAPPVAPIATENVLEDTVQRENTYMESIDSAQTPQEQSAVPKAWPPRLEPVTMRDWLSRKFIFPVDMCQSWEGLHNLIQEAFGHLIEYRAMVEKGCYSISHVTGEVILPSTWQSFVRPGLEIKMEIQNAFDADQDIFNGKALGGKRENDGPKILIPPHAPEVPALGSPMVLRSMSGNESSIDDVADDETDGSFPDGISYVERSDPRYLSIENVLLEQKKAKVEAEMKLERNTRFFQIKQQLVDQGAAIHALQDAADHAEQDTKLAWLEKQVRDQKEELGRRLLTTPPSSSAGDSLSKSAGSPQRRPSLARLFGRMPSRSVRSKGSIQSQQLITEG